MPDELLTEPVSADQSRRDDPQMLLDFLRNRDVPCPLCGYNLRALSSSRCPECGRDLELRVGLTEPRQAAWLTAQIALACTAGIGMLAIASVATTGWPTGMAHQRLFNFAFIYFMISIPFAALLLWKRRRCLRLPITTQRSIAALAIAGGIASITACIIAGV